MTTTSNELSTPPLDSVGFIEAEILDPEPTVKRGGRRPRADRLGIGINGTVILVILAVLVVAPVGFLIYGALRTGAPGLPGTFTLDNFAFLVSPEFLGYLKNTVLLAVGGTALGFLIAVGLAIAILRVKVPFARQIDSLVILPAYVPPVLIAFAWILMLSPQVGFLNTIFKDVGLPTIDIYSLGGIIWVMGISLAPIAYLYIRPAILAVDTTLEEAAWTVGATKFQTLRSVVLKMAAPGLMSAILIIFVNALGEFTIPATLGPTNHIETISSQLLVFVSEFPGSPNKAAVMGLFLMAISILGLLLNQRVLRNRVYSTVGGKGAQEGANKSSFIAKLVASVLLGLYLLVVLVIPAFSLTVGSLQSYASPDFSAPWTLDNFTTLAQYPNIVTALTNTILLSLGAAVIAMALSVAIARMYLRSPRFGKFLDQVGSLTIAIPHIVFGIAMLWMWIQLRAGVYGSPVILLLAYTALFLPLGIRVTVSAVQQLDHGMEEAAQVAGAKRSKITRLVVLPNIIPSLISGGTVVLYHAMRELAASLILFTSTSLVFSIVFWQLFQGGRVTPAMAVGVINTLMIFAVVGIANLILRFVIRRQGKVKSS